MHLDPILPTLVGIALVMISLGLVSHVLKQPSIIGYLLAGIIVGPYVLGWVTDLDYVTRLGAFGVVLLLFFVGMEVSLPRLLSQWKIAVLGTLLQILLSVVCAWGLGLAFDWPLERSLLLGFVISLSSTAVVFKVLQDQNEMHTTVGQQATGILIAQDFAVIPMLIVVSVFGGQTPTAGEVTLQVVGGLLLFGLLAWLIRTPTVHMPFQRWLRADQELEVFVAFFLCFGLALLTGWMHLSAALGAFVAGIFISAARETSWVHERLEPFRIVFVALFFISVGMLVDLSFVWEHKLVISLFVLAAYLTNTFVNAFALRLLGQPWKTSLYAGAVLAQIGEFSFILAAVGAETGMISSFGYQITVAVIAISLLISPLWIAIARRLFSSPAASLPKPSTPSR